jgi:hypothetical protein
MSRNRLGVRLGSIVEEHREKKEWTKHPMSWKFPTRKNYEAWLASQRHSSGEVSERNTLQTTASNTSSVSVSGSEEASSPVPNKTTCTSGFGDKKYKKVNGKWQTCGGRRKTQKRKTQKRKAKTQKHKRR